MALTDVHPASTWPVQFYPLRQGVVARLWARFRAWQAQRETIRLLYSVDSATLRELGISPREIESLVYGDGADRLRSYDRDWWRI
jgi:uncharacterized protein YjiS (DUF1127 family)